MKKLLLIALGLSVIIFSSCQKQEFIGRDNARAIALKHANLTEEQVKFADTDTDIDNGKKVYEIEFYTKDFTEYNYEIDAVTGEILAFDSEAEGFSKKTDAQKVIEPQTTFTEADAKKKVIERVPGATEENIREFRKEFDDGKEHYEGKIIYENFEYEFEVDAKTGEIISWESESVFD